MFITMLGDMTAFMSLVFGYFFYWTIHEDFPPEDAMGPGTLWPTISLAIAAVAWALTVLAQKSNRNDRPVLFYLSSMIAIAMSLCAAIALGLAPYLTQMDPSSHVYPAIVCVLVLWTSVHLCVGTLMQTYCVARRMAGKMTASYDADITNVMLYWHFMALTSLITVAVIAWFPWVA